MYGLCFTLAPETPNGQWPQALKTLPCQLHRRHTEIELGKELLHMAYLCLAFVGIKEKPALALLMMGATALYLFSLLETRKH